MAISTGLWVVFEAGSQEVLDVTSTPPFIYELTPDGARRVLDDVFAQAGRQ